MQKIVPFICLLFNISENVSGFELYIPYNIQIAYEKGTRSYDGRPGPDYFQNKSSYRIKADFDPDSKILKGREWITYQNNSPEVLNRIVIRLYQDYFKKGNSRDKAVNPSDVYNGTKIKYLSINDTVYNIEDPLSITRSGTSMIVLLQDYLLPRKSLKIVIDWEFKFPEKTTERFGTYNNTSFMVAYWYPQIAVFDDIDGWDYIGYNGTQEFYNDFNNFNCEITVPSKYLVWATGEWLNPDEILKEKYLSRYNQSKTSDVVIQIVSGNELERPSKGRKKSIFRFKAENVPDFAFATSNNYVWDARSIQCSDYGTRKTVNAVYSKKSEGFKSAADITAMSICKLSTNYVDVLFPFSNLTAFNGSEGMEFPMMINIGNFSTYKGMVYVISHETGHMYFPFMVGTNEQKYAWMDEGFVTFLAKLADGDLTDNKNPFNDILNIFEAFSGNEEDVALMVPSNQLRGITYQMQAYYRSSTALYYLREYLGQELFQKALIEYINRWQGKHPTPYDFFFTFNNVTAKDLNWFWDAWFFHSGWIDLAVENVESIKNGYKIIIQNTGKLPVTFNLNLLYEDNETETISIPVDSWKNNLKDFVFIKNTIRKIKQVYLNDTFLPDKNKENNYYQLNN